MLWWMVFMSVLSTPAAAIQTSLRVDLAMSELVTSNGVGRFHARRTRQFLQSLNRIWKTCGVEFQAAGPVQRLRASREIPFRPRTQADLSRLADRLHPPSFRRGSIPFTLAGNWTDLEPSGGMKLHGLGWAFYSPRDSAAAWPIERLGALVAGERLETPGFAQLAAHEIGHALSLGHSGAPNNVMAGGDQLEPAQCAQVRMFIERAVLPAVAKPMLVATNRAR